MPARLPGIHHVTCITGDVQRNVDFYVSVLGLRFIKKTVNFDVPDTYHLYFADYLGTPGTAMTFFGWPHLPVRPGGTGQVTTVSFAVPDDSMDYWSSRLGQFDLRPERIERFGLDTLAFADPDGIELELVGQASDDRWAPWADGPVPTDHAIRGFHSVTLCEAIAERTVELLTGKLGFQEQSREGRRARFTTGSGGPHSIVDVVELPDAPVGEEAVGTVHHVAWRAVDGDHQLAWREVVELAGLSVTPVIERKYFRSIYFREPGGVLFEIATDKPGFTVDEAPEQLGSGLQLPPQYEGNRDNLKFNLPPIVVPATAATGAGE